MDINAAVDARVNAILQAAIPGIAQMVAQSLQGQPEMQQPVQQFQQPVQQFQQPVQQFQQPVQQFQQPVQQLVQQAQVTADMIQSLIGPLVLTEQGKQAVIAAMQGVGVQNLTEARPDQLPALYAAFQQVAANMGGGMIQQQPQQQFQQPVQQQPVQQGGMSII